MKKNIIVAFGSVPKDGGTYTFYRTIRPKLLEYGIDMRCVTVGKIESDLISPAFVDDGCVVLGESSTDLKEQAKVFAGWCEEAGVDIVFAINSAAILSALPHLPEKIRVMSRIASISDHGYKITISCYERIMSIVTTAPRHAFDLTREYGVQKDRIHMIPNGIAQSLFDDAAQSLRGDNPTLRLGFMGRFEHNHKGVLFLPEIIHRLHDKELKFSFRIAGKGVYGETLKKRLKEFIQMGIVEFIGTIPPNNIPVFLDKIDIFLFPSQLEGCPNALLEAVMAGCVPVAWVIEGVTDFIIKDGHTGFLCQLGDCNDFADKIVELDNSRNQLRKMSQAAAEDARKRFSQDRVAAEYARLIKDAMQTPPPFWAPLPWSSFRPDPAFADDRRWHSVLPGSLKRQIKNCLFYLGISDRYYD